jgi:hypothetical protein
MGQVVAACAPEWSGGAVVVRCETSPRPPPNWPTIVSDVGTEFAPNVRLFVKPMLRPPVVAALGMVITTGDQPVAAGFNWAQVAEDPPTGVPQL